MQVVAEIIISKKGDPSLSFECDVWIENISD